MTNSPRSVRSQCPYCGVGCGLELLPPAVKGQAVKRDAEGNPMWTARGDREHPSSLGQVCIKGATVGETLAPGRLRQPLFRPTLEDDFAPISWDDALNKITGQIQASVARRGNADGIAMYGSGQFHTEDYYLAQKLLKGALGTNNFDANSRLCMSSAVAGYTRSLGSDGPPCSYEDLDHCSVAFLIGTNTAECHPVLFQRLLKRKRKNPGSVKIVVVDPRRTDTAKAADIHLPIAPGSDLALLHGIAHLVLRENGQDPAFIDDHTENYDAFFDVAARWTPRRVALFCNIPEKRLREVAALFHRREKVLSLWSMGVNQRREGTAVVQGLINLHLLTGQIGKQGAGPFSLTGQPNAMGGREAGGLAHLLPGYRLVANAEHRAEVEQAWRLPAGRINAKPGLAAWQQIEAMEQGGAGSVVGGSHQPPGEPPGSRPGEVRHAEVPAGGGERGLRRLGNVPLRPPASARSPVEREGRRHDQFRTAGHLLPGLPAPLRREPSRLGGVCRGGPAPGLQRAVQTSIQRLRCTPNSQLSPEAGFAM